MPESQLLTQDKPVFGRLPGVTVHDIDELSPSEIMDIIDHTDGPTIAGFCFSDVCLPGISGGWKPS